MNDTNVPVSLTLVIPCYNESDRVGLLFAGLESFFAKWKESLQVVIINDGSKDNTEILLKEHPVYKRNSNIIAIHTQANTGKGGALRNGVLKATGRHILTLDADMASPPEELIKWQKLVGGTFADDTIYIGSREHRDSVITKQGDRKLAGNIFNFIVRAISPLKGIRDTQCGFKLYPAAEAKRLFGTLQTFGWAHDVELLYKAHLDKMKIVEMPLTWNAIEGSKIVLLRDGFNMLKEILVIASKTRKEYRKK